VACCELPVSLHKGQQWPSTSARKARNSRALSRLPCCLTSLE